MAKVEPALPFDHFSGKLSRKERIVMRTRNGRTYDLAERYRFCDPFAEREIRCKGTAFFSFPQEGTRK